MKYKTAALAIAALTPLLFVAIPAALVYVVDPFQIYHKSFFAKAGYSTNQHYQHAGWINTVLADPANHYESVVIGSSTMANYTQALIDEHVPWGNVLNLSVNGSTPVMQAATAQHALKKNPTLKHLMWDVHLYYTHDPEFWGDPSVPDRFPYYLYNDSIADDFHYLINATNVATAFRFLWSDFSGFTAGIVDNGPFYEAELAQGRFTSFSSGENIRNTLLPSVVEEVRPIPANKQRTAYTYPSIDKNLLSIIQPLCNSTLDIVITFSPATRASYASINTDYLYKQLMMRRYLVDQTANCHNIRIFAFDNIDPVTTRLENYADHYHYTTDVNHYIMQSIAEDRDRLTIENLDTYEKLFIENINNYRVVLAAQLAAKEK